MFPEVPVVAHPAEVADVRDPETLLAAFGMAAADADVVRRQLPRTFGLTGHERVGTVDDGAVLDLGRGPERCSTCPDTPPATAAF